MNARDDIAAHFTSDTLVDQLLDAYRAEILSEEMRNLRRIEREDTPEGALGTRTGLLRAALILDERAESIGEKATAPAATATPQLDGRLARLLAAIHAHGGEWSTAKVQALYRKSGPSVPLRATARKDLHALHALGHLVVHHERGRQFYTLNTPTGGAR